MLRDCLQLPLRWPRPGWATRRSCERFLRLSLRRLSRSLIGDRESFLRLELARLALLPPLRPRLRERCLGRSLPLRCSGAVSRAALSLGCGGSFATTPAYDRVAVLRPLRWSAISVSVVGERPISSSRLESCSFSLVLSKNNFNFNNEHYLQVGGTAMGTKLAPSYANIFMDYFERTFVYTYEVQPLLWKRYIDDIFVLWTAGAQTLTSFVEYLDNCLPSMKFEANISDSTINFLDVRATIKENTITTSLYTKETDTLSYLDYSSCHPKSCKNGIPYSQFLRLRRICSEDEDFVLQSEKLALSFHRANYPDNVIQSSFDKAFNIDRESLFQRGPSTNNNQKDDPKLFLITDFHPSYQAVLDIVSQNWDMLDNSSSTRPLLHIPVIRGFRRPKKIRDLLVRAKLTQPDSNGLANTNPRTRRKKCTRFNCTYCKCIDKSGKIICPFNKRTYISRYNVSCISNNLVYGLYCKVCHKIYVGQTKRELRARIGEHFTSIRKHKKHLVVGRHYNSAGHTGINNVIVYALEFVTTHPDAPLSKKRRESCEQKWIFRLRSSIPLGLNLTE